MQDFKVWTTLEGMARSMKVKGPSHTMCIIPTLIDNIYTMFTPKKEGLLLSLLDPSSLATALASFSPMTLTCHLSYPATTPTPSNVWLLTQTRTLLHACLPFGSLLERKGASSVYLLWQLHDQVLLRLNQLSCIATGKKMSPPRVNFSDTEAADQAYSQTSTS